MGPYWLKLKRRHIISFRLKMVFRFLFVLDIGNIIKNILSVKKLSISKLVTCVCASWNISYSQAIFKSWKNPILEQFRVCVTGSASGLLRHPLLMLSILFFCSWVVSESGFSIQFLWINRQGKVMIFLIDNTTDDITKQLKRYLFIPSSEIFSWTHFRHKSAITFRVILAGIVSDAKAFPHPLK